MTGEHILMSDSSGRVSCPRRASERGSVLVLTALSLTMLLTLAAFSLTAGLAYDRRNSYAAAADAAAKSGAVEVWRNNAISDAQLANFARAELSRMGLSGASVTIRRCTTGGASCASPHNQPTYVEAIVSAPMPALLGGFLTSSIVTPTGRAVAGASAGPNCLVSLSQTGTSLTVGGTANINMPGCNIAANGNMEVGNGAGSVVAANVGVQGSCGPDCPDNTQAHSGVPVSDPLRHLTAPPNPYGAPAALTIANNQPPQTINPGWYSQLIIGNSDAVTFNPGLYWITGPILVGNQAALAGSGVFFYLDGIAPHGTACDASSTAGCISVPNSATVTLSAQTSGAYHGVLFYQAPSNGTNASFNNAGTYNLSGAMYFPAAAVSYGNSGTSNDCTIFVAHTINLAGSGGGQSTFSNTCSAYGGSPVLTVSLAE